MRHHVFTHSCVHVLHLPAGLDNLPEDVPNPSGATQLMAMQIHRALAASSSISRNSPAFLQASASSGAAYWCATGLALGWQNPRVFPGNSIDLNRARRRPPQCKDPSWLLSISGNFLRLGSTAFCGSAWNGCCRAAMPKINQHTAQLQCVPPPLDCAWLLERFLVPGSSVGCLGAT